MGLALHQVVILQLLWLIPIAILYYVIKFAVKNAIKELKNQGYL